MVKAVESAAHDFTTIRTGRANPLLLDKVVVEVYGSTMPINQLANVSVPEPRQLMIAPWDRNMLSHIEKAILKSDIGLTPNSDGNVIRLNIPQLTEERRKEFIKLLHKKTEEHRVAIRNIRRDANDELKHLEKDGHASEDEIKRTQEQIQKKTDKHIEEIDRLTKVKEAELLEV
jgi:ribosome recycling factor